MKKRLISLIMLLAIGSTLVGCGKSDSSNKSSQPDKKATENVESSSEDKAKDETENDKDYTTESKESKEQENTTDAIDTTDATDNNGTDITDEVSAESKKQIYLDKLNETEETLSVELKPAYDSGVTLDMREAAAKEYETWDGLLNEIWGVLIDQLSEEEMDELTDLENKWIEDTEAKAEEESLKYEGGTMEPFAYSQTLAIETKNRCYELVNEYMK